eukprot:2657965-Amphidinium_carterae.1
MSSYPRLVHQVQVAWLGFNAIVVCFFSWRPAANCARAQSFTTAARSLSLHTAVETSEQLASCQAVRLASRR